MTELDERNVDPINELSRIAQDHLVLSTRGFRESFRASKPEKLIFDSEWCRISLLWEGWDYMGGNSVYIRYGRLHALNDRDTMLWNGEECHCWHRFEHPLHFLDGRTANDAAKLDFAHPLTREFRGEELKRKFDRRQPEWLAELHLTIWQQYGQQFFSLFDLRQPSLWQQYRQFLKEVYDIAGRKNRFGPPLDKVC